MQEGLLPFTHIATFYGVIKKASDGEKPQMLWNMKGRPPAIEFTELEHFHNSRVGSPRSISSEEVLAFISEKKRRATEARGIKVLVPTAVEISNRSVKRYKTQLMLLMGGGACTSTIQKINWRLTAENSLRAVVTLPSLCCRSNSLLARSRNKG